MENKGYRCRYCAENFDGNREEFLNHMQYNVCGWETNPKSMVVNCYLCGARMKKQSFYYHLKKYSCVILEMKKNKVIQCRSCKKIFASRKSLRTHRKTRVCKKNKIEKPANESPVKWCCIFCETRYECEEDFRAHLQNHLRDGHHCVHCDYQFEDFDVWKDHESQCGSWHSARRAWTGYELMAEIAKAHAKAKEQEATARLKASNSLGYKCCHCHYTFDDAEICKVHERLCDSRDKTNCCAHCGYRFDDVDLLKVHETDCGSWRTLGRLQTSDQIRGAVATAHAKARELEAKARTKVTNNSLENGRQYCAHCEERFYDRDSLKAHEAQCCPWLTKHNKTHSEGHIEPGDLPLNSPEFIELEEAAKFSFGHGKAEKNRDELFSEELVGTPKSESSTGKLIVCLACGRDFENEADFKKHLQEYHSVECRKDIVEGFMGFRTQHQMISSDLIKKPVEAKPFKSSVEKIPSASKVDSVSHGRTCYYCFQKFDTERELQLHWLLDCSICYKDVDYCEYCEKQFGNTESLKAHAINCCPWYNGISLSDLVENPVKEKPFQSSVDEIPSRPKVENSAEASFKAQEVKFDPWITDLNDGTREEPVEPLDLTKKSVGTMKAEGTPKGTDTTKATDVNIDHHHSSSKPVMDQSQDSKECTGDTKCSCFGCSLNSWITSSPLKSQVCRAPGTGPSSVFPENVISKSELQKQDEISAWKSPSKTDIFGNPFSCIMCDYKFPDYLSLINHQNDICLSTTTDAKQEPKFSLYTSRNVPFHVRQNMSPIGSSGDIQYGEVTSTTPEIPSSLNISSYSETDASEIPDARNIFIGSEPNASSNVKINNSNTKHVAFDDQPTGSDAIERNNSPDKGATKKIHCLTCGKSMSSLRTLREHVKRNVCTPWLKPKCEYCAHVFTSHIEVRRHQVYCEGWRDVDDRTCSLCSDVFVTIGALRKHSESGVCTQPKEEPKTETHGNSPGDTNGSAENGQQATDNLADIVNLDSSLEASSDREFLGVDGVEINGGPIDDSSEDIHSCSTCEPGPMPKKEIPSNSPTDKMHECPTCKTIYASRRVLFEHLKLKACIPWLRPKCQNCGNFYRSKKELQKHIESGACKGGKTSLKCESCLEVFGSIFSFRAHRQSGECKNMEWECGKCGLSFKSARNLRYHVSHKVCSQNKSAQLVECGNCKERFLSRGALRIHWKRYVECRGKLSQQTHWPWFRPSPATTSTSSSTSGFRPSPATTSSASSSTSGKVQSSDIEDDIQIVGDDMVNLNSVSISEKEQSASNQMGISHTSTKDVELDGNANHDANLGQENFWKCQKCNVKIAPNMYRNHLSFCSKSLQCISCKKLFTSSRTLRAHIKNRVCNPEASQFKECPYCNNLFQNDYALFKHLEANRSCRILAEQSKKLSDKKSIRSMAAAKSQSPPAIQIDLTMDYFETPIAAITQTTQNSGEEVEVLDGDLSQAMFSCDNCRTSFTCGRALRNHMKNQSCFQREMSQKAQEAFLPAPNREEFEVLEISDSGEEN